MGVALWHTSSSCSCPRELHKEVSQLSSLCHYTFTASTPAGPSVCPAIPLPAKVSFCSQPLPPSSPQVLANRPPPSLLPNVAFFLRREHQLSTNSLLLLSFLTSSPRRRAMPPPSTPDPSHCQISVPFHRCRECECPDSAARLPQSEF